jgi:serine/threonine-protein kinase RsbW
MTVKPDQNGAGRAARGEDRFARRFPAEPYAVREALRAAVARFARRISPEDAGALELTLAEVLNNVVEHAYGGCAGGEVDLALSHAGGALCCRIEDCGRPMPHLAIPEGALPPTGMAVTKLAEGGWGWSLVRGLTENLTYERDGDRNRLTFRIPLDAV